MVDEVRECQGWGGVTARKREREDEDQAYLIVLVDAVHTMFAFLLIDDFACVFHNNLVRLECSVRAHPISSIFRLNHLNASVVFSALLHALPQSFESPIPTLVFLEITVPGITFIVHEPIHAVRVTPRLRCAETCGMFKELGGAPLIRGIAYKDILVDLSPSVRLWLADRERTEYVKGQFEVTVCCKEASAGEHGHRQDAILLRGLTY